MKGGTQSNKLHHIHGPHDYHADKKSSACSSVAIDLDLVCYYYYLRTDYYYLEAERVFVVASDDVLVVVAIAVDAIDFRIKFYQ